MEVRRFNASSGKNEIDRVRAHTAQNILDEIDRGMKNRIQYYATQSENAITRRIEELEREWDNGTLNAYWKQTHPPLHL